MVPDVENVGLEDVEPRRDPELFERWLRSPHISRWWGNPEPLLRMLAERPMDTHALITADGRPVGYLCWQRPSPQELEAAALTDLPPDLVDIDILIGEPEYLGRGVGPQALILLLARLQSEGVEFAGVGTSTSNRVAVKAFEKAGFRFFREFEEAESGRCTYMIVQLRDAVEQLMAVGGAARRR